MTDDDRPEGQAEHDPASPQAHAPEADQPATHAGEPVKHAVGSRLAFQCGGCGQWVETDHKADDPPDAAVFACPVCHKSNAYAAPRRY